MAIRKNRETIRKAASHVIRKHREGGSMSQLALANSLGISQPLVSAWECGKIAPSVEDLVGIEQVLGLAKGTVILEVAYGENE